MSAPITGHAAAVAQIVADALIETLADALANIRAMSGPNEPSVAAPDALRMVHAEAAEALAAYMRDAKEGGA